MAALKLVTIDEATEKSTRLDLGNLIYESDGNGGAKFDANELPDSYGAAIHEGFRHYREHFLTPDLTEWFRDAALAKTPALLLRRTGGVYFFPQTALKRLKAVIEVLRQAGGSPFCIGAYKVGMNDTSAVAQVQDSARSEFEDAVATLNAFMAEEEERQKLWGTDKAMRKRPNAIMSRMGEIVKLGEKVATYESLLRFKADDIKTKLDELRLKMATAYVLNDN